MDRPEKEHRSDDEAEYEDEEVDPRIQVASPDIQADIDSFFI